MFLQADSRDRPCSSVCITRPHLHTTVMCDVFAAVYLVFAFQHCPDGKITNADASPLAADGRTSRKRTREDCDGGRVEKQRPRDDGL